MIILLISHLNEYQTIKWMREQDKQNCYHQYDDVTGMAILAHELKQILVQMRIDVFSLQFLIRATSTSSA